VVSGDPGQQELRSLHLRTKHWTERHVLQSSDEVLLKGKKKTKHRKKHHRIEQWALARWHRNPNACSKGSL
jgi:hypothetical protein